MARRARPAGWPPAAFLAALLVTLAAPAVQAQSVACHISYGGESRLIEARPTLSPYQQPPVAIGSFFLFRIVFRSEPADLAGIKLYTYADRDGGPLLVHQASYPYPTGNAPTYGFSGLNYVYEPLRDGELQYWCELVAEAAK